MVNMSEITKEMIAALSFTEEEKEALDKARKNPISFDKDCPETTPEQALKFRRVNPLRNTLKKRAIE